MRTRAVAIVALLVSAAPASAQLPELGTLGPDWVEVFYPKVFWTKRSGFTFGMFYGQIRPMTFDDWGDPQPYRAALTLDAQASTEGRWDAELALRFPKLGNDWRAEFVLAAERNPRERYFGLGNASVYFSDSVTSSQERFHDSDNRHLYARGAVQRRVVGPVRVLGGLHVERWRVRAPSGPSLLAKDIAAGIDPTLGRAVDDVSARLGIVLDTRDDEVSPRRGVLVEALVGWADSSVAGDVSYTRTTVSAAGYVPIGKRVVVAARLTGQSMSEAAGAGSYYWIESSGDPARGVGGSRSHRAVFDLRYLGPDKLLGNLDVRYDIYTIETLAALTLLGYVDTGRVFGPRGFELTTDGLHTGGGGGLFLQWGRTAVLGFILGHGPDGAVFQFATQWAY